MEENGKVMESAKVSPRRGVLRQHLGAIAAANAGTIGGLGLGWSSAAYGVASGEQGFPVTAEEWSWVSSLFTIGAALGSLSVGKLVFTLGRKMVLLCIAPVTLIAWALHIWATEVWMLYVGRLVLGLAGGAACVSVPIYISEMSQPDIRGALSSYFEALICAGILIVYLLGKELPLLWLNVVCSLFSVVLLLGMLCFPDTPRWYLLRDRPEDARRSLLFYRDANYNVDAELQLIKQGIQENASAVSSWKAFSTKAAKKGVTLAIILMLFQQITGVNAITFYATKLFTEAGLFDANTASVIVGATELLSACISMCFVDNLGRRVLLMISATSMAICTGLLGAFFFAKEYLSMDVDSLSWLSIVFVCVYMFTFSVGFGPVPWVFLGEILPDNIKGVASSVATGVSWLAASLVTKFYPGLADTLGNWVCYWIFCGLCVLSCLFIGLFLPETKGRTLDEIQDELASRKKK